MEDQTEGCRVHGVGASSIDTTTLCSWGANGHGQLGQGHTDDQLIPISIIPECLPKELHSGISCIGGGGGFSFIVTGDGHICTCGNNDRGQLGHPHLVAGEARKITNVSLFTPCALLSAIKIVKAASGWDFMIALSDNGSVYSWGSNTFGQLGRRLDEEGPSQKKDSNVPGQIHFSCKTPQLDVAAGLRHALSVSVSHSLYAWGHGKKGQLGSATKGITATPQRVTVPSTEKTLAPFAGMYHSGCLTASGSIYMWGCNMYGQCGVAPSESIKYVTTPTSLCVVGLGQECVVVVCSGWTHLVARTDKGHLYSWGRANLGQLGRHSDAGFDHSPGRVEGLSGVTSHMCGSEHNIALTTANEVYTWGWNEHGICATGDEENVPRPRRVTLPLSKDSVIGVGCGTGHTFCTGIHRASTRTL